MRTSTFTLLVACISLAFLSCDDKKPTDLYEVKSDSLSNNKLVGTWKLLTGTLVEKGDTTVTDYTKTSSFIKIINATHFAFIQHDLQKGKDSTASFSAGGGTYSLKDSSYTEYLEYCNAREWEGHDFNFTVTISTDTLVQRGVEVIESQGIDRLNIEKYVRLK